MPQPIEIFRAGRHTAMSGETIGFSESDIDGVVASYDPKVHEAPIVVGHPRADAPAYGWVRGLERKGGTLEASVDDVDPAFAELVRAKRFKKVSASFYRPDSPSNPKPGGWYLRHVGFLGAQPPSVKGLRDASFAGSADDCVTVELAEADAATLFTRLREWMIGKFGQDEADKVLPEDLISGADASSSSAASKTKAKGGDSADASSSGDAADLSESDLATALRRLRDWFIGKFGQDEAEKALPGSLIDWAQTGAAVDDAVVATPAASYAESPELAAKAAELATREAALAAREKAARRAEHEAFLESLLRDGRPMLCAREHALSFLELLDTVEAGTVSFGEKETRRPVDIFREELLARMPRTVDLGERAAPGGEELDGDDAEAVAARASAYQAEQRGKGLIISTAEAVRHVKGVK